jgi:isocitrate/isopropylmalate dehydrogenase
LKTCLIASIPGDGIGNEVIPAGWSSKRDAARTRDVTNAVLDAL